MEILVRCAGALQNLMLHKGFETWVQNMVVDSRLPGLSDWDGGSSPLPDTSDE